MHVLCPQPLSVARIAFTPFLPAMSSSMSLLRALQSDNASVLMQYIDTSHRQLLAVARPLRRSQTFAWAAAAGQDFNPFKFDKSLRDDIFCRRVLVSMSGCEMHYNRLWTSIPETHQNHGLPGLCLCKRPVVGVQARSSKHSG